MNWDGKKWIKSRWHWQPRQNGRSQVGNVNYRSSHQTLNRNVPLRQWPLGKLFDVNNFNSSGPVFLFGVLFVTAYHDIMSSWHHHDIVWHRVTSSCDIIMWHVISSWSFQTDHQSKDLPYNQNKVSVNPVGTTTQIPIFYNQSSPIKITRAIKNDSLVIGSMI